MGGLVEFFFEAIIVAIAGAFFIGLVAFIFDAVIPRVSPKKSHGGKAGKASTLFEKGEYFDVLLNSGQWIENVRHEEIVQINDDQDWPDRSFVLMRDRNERKVLVRLDSVRVMQGVQDTGHG